MMCEQCRQREQEREDAARWLAELLRRVGLLLVTEVERRYDLEPSVRTKHERERHKRERARAA